MPRQIRSGTGAADLVVAERLVAAVAVRFVGAVLALAQEVILALRAFEGLGHELAALVRTVAKRLLAALATDAKVILATFLERDFDGAIIGNHGLAHGDFSWLVPDAAVLRRRHHSMIRRPARPATID